MKRHLTILTAVCASLLLIGCSEKSEAEKLAEERTKLQDTKRVEAAKNYKLLAEKFPDNEHAKEAAQKASALEAQKK